jgi:hypothetical protein
LGVPPSALVKTRSFNHNWLIVGKACEHCVAVGQWGFESDGDIVSRIGRILVLEGIVLLLACAGGAVYLVFDGGWENALFGFATVEVLYNGWFLARRWRKQQRA